MGDLTRRIRHDEEYYVAKMNLRHNEDLKKQIKRLNREKEMRGKTIEVDQKPYEEKLRKLSARVGEIEQLSRDISDSSSGSGVPNCEDSLLKDLTRKSMVTGAGYSYAKSLLKNAEPLVKRPLQWGINPSLSTLKYSSSDPILTAQTSDHGVLNSISLIPHVKGKSLSLKHKYADFETEKQRKPRHLPPLRTKIIFDRKKQTLSSVRSYHWKPKGSVNVKENCVIANQPSACSLTREKPIDVRECKGSKEKAVLAETVQIVRETLQNGTEVPRIVVADQDGKDYKESHTKTDELEDKAAQKLGVFVTESFLPSYDLTELRRNSDALDLVLKRKRNTNMNASFSKCKLQLQRPRRYSF